MDILNIKIILKILKQAIKIVYKNDKYLFKYDVHEQAISHRIAYYFENLLIENNNNWFKEYNLDTEYNRNLDDSKRAFSKCRKCNLTKKCTLKSLNNEISFNSSCKPDIILHKRGLNNLMKNDLNNIIIIEMKKNKQQDNDDFAKLSAFTCSTSDYKYLPDY